MSAKKSAASRRSASTHKTRKTKAKSVSPRRRPATVKKKLTAGGGGTSATLKGWGKEIGKGALAGLGGFAVSAIMTAIMGDPMAEKLAEIGKQLSAISDQLNKIQTTLNKLLDVNNAMLDALNQLLEVQQKAGLKDMQKCVDVIKTMHGELMRCTKAIDAQGKTATKKSELEKDLNKLLVDIQTRPSIQEQVNALDSLMFGAPLIDGMIDVVISHLRKAVRKGQSLESAFNQLEEFATWFSYYHYNALALLTNVEVSKRADPKVPTAHEGQLARDMNARLLRLGDRLVAFAESMADELDRKNEFFGGLDPTLLRREPSWKRPVQYAKSIIARADRIRDNLLGRTSIIVRVIPHVPLLPIVDRRGQSDVDILFADPKPSLSIVFYGRGDVNVLPTGNVWRGVPSDGVDFQNPPLTHGLYFFVYEYDIESRLNGDETLKFRIGFTYESAQRWPVFHYAADDMQDNPILADLEGSASRQGGVSLMAVTYGYVSGHYAKWPRFRIRNMQFSGHMLEADPVSKKVKLVPETISPNAYWVISPEDNGRYWIKNVGTGMYLHNANGNQQPVDLWTRQEMQNYPQDALWILGGVHASGQHYPIIRNSDRGQHVSALVSDKSPRQQRDRGDFRAGHDGVRTIGSDVLGPGGHLYWQLETIDGSKAWEKRV
jgi:hypothetical protein